MTAAHLPGAAAQSLLVAGPLQQAADVHAQMAEELASLFVNLIRVFYLPVQFFEHLTEFIIVHGNKSPWQALESSCSQR